MHAVETGRVGNRIYNKLVGRVVVPLIAERATRLMQQPLHLVVREAVPVAG